jgi:GNAT superfamily N-acetyltransferase
MAGYAEMQPMHAKAAPEHFAAGGELWLVRDGENVVFACWIFPERTPVGDAPGGWLTLPPGVQCLEDSVAAPAARGRGIAPATWALVADVLERRGAETLVTKVSDDNTGTQRAIAKAGFVAIAAGDALGAALSTGMLL